MKRYIYLFLGFVTLGLGILGIFLPVLPTTPFLLLTSFFFVRSSDRLNRWLMNHRVFGPQIRSFTEHRALKQSTKVTSVATMWLSMGLSMYFIKNIYVSALLVLIGVSVSYYIISLKTLKPEKI